MSNLVFSSPLVFSSLPFTHIVPLILHLHNRTGCATCDIDSATNLATCTQWACPMPNLPGGACVECNMTADGTAVDQCTKAGWNYTFSGSFDASGKWVPKAGSPPV